MNIALLHHRRLPVQGYGGTERIVEWLARGLAELGHAVTLIGPEGSRVPEARLVPASARALADPELDPRPLLPPGIDVLHAHRPLLARPGLPLLWTMHGVPTGGVYPPNAVCLSAHHAVRCGVTAYVHNGLDPREYRFEPRKGDYDLFLGRLHSAKGWRWAVRGARAAGRRIVVAGGWRPVLRRGVRVVGTVDGERKRDLLAGAACLWMPARWDEPFGLTLIEAMASGTPVLGTRRGALPEIVTPDVGALGDTLEELVALRPGIATIAAEACRARVEQHFTHVAMAERYVAVYRRVVESGTVSESDRPLTPDS
jgi:glycosyltransferase involved in cell wall biosynthesis